MVLVKTSLSDKFFYEYVSVTGESPERVSSEYFQFQFITFFLLNLFSLVAESIRVDSLITRQLQLRSREVWKDNQNTNFMFSILTVGQVKIW